MRKIYTFSLVFFTILVSFGTMSNPVYAQELLPEADWYATVWNRVDNTLHWVNEQGEQATINIPQLHHDMSAAQIHFSPNGRYALISTPFNATQTRLGFYDFQIGQWLQIHETQQGESVSYISHLSTTFISDKIAISFNTPATDSWRVILFDMVTGNAQEQIESSDPVFASNSYTSGMWQPVILRTMFDLAANRYEVYFQMVAGENNPTNVPLPTFRWIINNAGNTIDVSFVNVPWNHYTGFDIMGSTGSTIYAFSDLAFMGQDTDIPQGHSDAILYSQALFSPNVPSPTRIVNNQTGVNTPRFLRDGAWIGYRNGADNTGSFWTITSLDETQALTLNATISMLHHTSDGFLAVSEQNRLYHVTSLLPASLDEPGVLLLDWQNLQSDSLQVVYSTPPHASFVVTSLGQTEPIMTVSPTETIVPVIQQSTVVPTVPATTSNDVLLSQSEPPSRVTIGEQFRVISPVGVRLDQDDYIFPPVGTIGTILASSSSGFWQVEIAHEGSTVIGTMPEGTYETGMGTVVTHYFIEPYDASVPVLEPYLLCNTAQQPPNYGDGTGVRITTTDAYVLLYVNIFDADPTARISDGQIAFIVSVPLCHENNWWQQIRYDTGAGLQTYWMQSYDPNGVLLYSSQLGE